MSIYTENGYLSMEDFLEKMNEKYNNLSMEQITDIANSFDHDDPNYFENVEDQLYKVDFISHGDASRFENTSEDEDEDDLTEEEDEDTRYNKKMNEINKVLKAHGEKIFEVSELFR